ncbi:hypothetical protein VNI00_009690 [Paramarasmius palmivorus]|uniref:Uncharacterized protein n=1 Tax=Paramarasmius palmivorus TaxID=297713 RepID=A0AAW0CP53_9AGAR
MSSNPDETKIHNAVQGNRMDVHNNTTHNHYHPHSPPDNRGRRIRNPKFSSPRLPRLPQGTSPHERYSQLLMEKTRGYPLWFPQPNAQLTKEYKQRGADIGDVGLLKEDGSFDFLFSIIHPHDHPVNAYGVPRGFEPVHHRHLEKHEIERFHCDDHHVCSQGLYLSKYTMYKSTNSSGDPHQRNTSEVLCENETVEGAILILPDGCSRIDLVNRATFLDQAIKHGASWLEYAASRRQEPTELYLITGCDKTSSWGIASFVEGGDETLSLVFNEIENNGKTTYKWTHNAWSTVHCKPETRKHPGRLSAADDYDNQSLFLRGFVISRHERSASASGVEREDGIDIPWSSSHEGSRRTSAARSLTLFDSQSQDASQRAFWEADHRTERVIEKPYHPCRAINLYLHHLLRPPLVTEDLQPLSDEVPIIVISHDDDWCGTKLTSEV